MPWKAIIAGLILNLFTSIIFRPKTQAQPPAGLDEIQVPTAEEGREIPVLFGCRYLAGPNVVWYGDLRTTAIKSKSGKK
ncbi:MAG: hypothetical protein AAF756_20575 [Pseudomonadota bacterium]